MYNMSINGILYIVPTPIGNLEDITLRALRVLAECDLIVCEDTRYSVKLLSHFKISKPLMSLHSYNELHRSEYIIKKMLNGKKIAVISNAGTPAISDPGHILIKNTINNNIKIEVLPGANAITTAFVASGLPNDGFVFCGFLKRKIGKIKKELNSLKNLNKTIIFYESKNRLIKTLEICVDIFDSDLKICIAKEITKKFEEFIRGNIVDVLYNIKNRTNLFGEFVVLIYYNK
jgi:16S rRNA (cytidine1402-2'-O)-methyltransferase